MTYDELKSALGEWLNRADLAAVIPTFIKAGEGAINRTLRTRDMVKRSRAIMEDEFLTLPADYLEAVNVQANRAPVSRMQYVTPEHADLLRGGVHQTAGNPGYFTVIGNQLELIPAPATEQEIELTYYAAVPALSGAQQTNWLLTKWPDLYIYAALVHSAPFLKEDERAATWQGLYTKILSEAQAADDKAQHSGSVLKMRAKTFG